METTWQKNWQAAQIYPPLRQDVFVDVAIIGGGITGTTLAYLLAKEGKKAVVLEKGTLRDSSHTAYTTAMIMAQVDTSFEDLIKIFGISKAKKVWYSGMDAISKIEKTIKEENIDCEFKRLPSYAYANNEKEWQDLKSEAEVLTNAGFPITLKQNGADLNIPNFGYYSMPDQAIFHPLKYCDGLRVAAVKCGAKFYENTEALDIQEKRPLVVRTSSGKVTAKWVIIATYDPFNKPKELFAKKGMYISYMYELSVPRGKLMPGLYVDYYNPYHYFRIDGVDRRARIIIGGADHREEIKMDPEKNYAEVLEYAEKIIGSKNYRIETKWRGQILETLDGIPYIGSYSEKQPNILVVTGFTGNGLTYSRTAAHILTDKIIGRKNIYSSLFNPTRRASFKALYIKGRDYIVEFFNGAVKNMIRSEDK